MPITGATRVFIVIGDPVAQVRAPEIYNHLFQRHGVDAVLVPMQVSAAHLAGFVRQTLHAHNVGGIWATIPHKPALLPLMARLDPVARVAGAVNMVRRAADGELEGALFDGLGFVNGLDHFGLAVAGRRVLVVGAGGGGRAVAAAIAQRGPACLAIYNRSAARAADLVQRLKPLLGDAMVLAEHSDGAGYDLVVNCTSQGLKAGDALPLDVASLEAGAAVVDIIMSRTPTPLLQACAARGIKAYPGFEMLVQQVPLVLDFVGLPELALTLKHDLSELRGLLMPR